jgi:regulatory protein
MSSRSTDAGPEADPEQVARVIALRRLESAPRTRRELADHLRSRGVPEEAAEHVLERFAEVGLIDDRAFAFAWVRSRHSGRGLGPRALREELRRKGVDPAHINEALSEIDADGERERALRLARARAPRLGGLASDAALRRLVGALTRRGYSPGLAFSVAQEALAGAGPD